jgi:hypothetical protein
MRILSGGPILIGVTSSFAGDANFFVYNASAGPSLSNGTSGQQTLLLWNRGTSGNNLFTEFHTDASLSFRGSIDYNRGAGVVRYNTTSDKNLKVILGDTDKNISLKILNSTKIRDYYWKNDNSQNVQVGVIAQELFETYKGAVVVGSNSDKIGNKDYKTWGVDKTAFTFHLIAGWQLHNEKITDLDYKFETQAEKIARLETRVQQLESK